MALICNRSPGLLIIAGLALAPPSPAGTSLKQEPAERPILVIESFRAARAYASGMDAFTLVGTIRNVGKAPLPADTVKGRMTILAGLEYVAGDTMPKLPELAPGSAVTYKFQVSPSRPDGPLVASLSVLAPGAPPLVSVFAIPRLESGAPPESPGVPKSPSASGGNGISILENDRVRLRLVNDISRDPVMLFSVRTSGGWRQIGASVPLVEIESAEPGQRAWWEQFNLEEVKTAAGAAEAQVKLSGKVGLKWQADLDLTLRAGSAVVDADLRLSALRAVIPTGIRFVPFLAGEGSFGASVTESVDEAPGGPAIHRAVRWGEISLGIVRRPDPPLTGWQAGNMTGVEAADFRVLGTEWRPAEASARLERGASIRMRTRLFALYPSQNVRESYNVAPPEAVPANRAHRSPSLYVRQPFCRRSP